MDAPRVLTVLPDHPLPSITGLHLRMVANIEIVNGLFERGLVAEDHVLWLGTSDSQGSDELHEMSGCASATHAADRVDEPLSHSDSEFCGASSRGSLWQF